MEELISTLKVEVYTNSCVSIEIFDAEGKGWRNNIRGEGGSCLRWVIENRVKAFLDQHYPEN